MSWLIGIIGKFNTDNIHKTILSPPLQPLHTIVIPDKLLIIAGGNPETLHVTHDNGLASVVAGIGLRRDIHSTHILSTNEWNERLQSYKPSFDDLNGHFIAVRFKDNRLECFSDKVGLRTLYFAQIDDRWIFSTKLSWVSRFLPVAAIDWSALGSKWLCLQQFSHRSLVQHTHKLPPNSSAHIERNTLSISSRPWVSVAPNSETAEHTIGILQSLLCVDQRKIKLGMSGGLDSRVLFSLLAAHGKNFSTYAFGETGDPDVVYAQMISRFGNCPFTKISAPFPSKDECLKLLQAYAAQTNLTYGAAAAVRLRHYPALREEGTIVLDGGNGEIGRRQFLQRILFRAKSAIVQLHTTQLFQYIRFHRADIFNDELTQEMTSHALQEFNQFLHSLPSPKEIGVENFLDLWIAQTRLPLVACDEQARIDEQILNFMPYTQPDFIQSVLNVPLRYRNNNRLYKLIIKKYFPTLSRISLVKNYITYPYHLSTLQTRVWTKAKTMFSLQYQEPTLVQFLDTLKEYVLDMVTSQSTKNYAPYNYSNILHAATSYYKGERKFAEEVNWWLVFDVWRRSVEK